MSDQIADGRSLVLDDLLLDVMSDAGVIADSLAVDEGGVRVMTVDVVGSLQKVLLDLDGLCQGLDFTDLSMNLDCVVVEDFEVMGNSALGSLLDHLETFAPGAVGESMQNLLEPRTILQVSSELSRQEQILVGSDELVVGVFDEIIVAGFFVENQ